MDVTTTIQQIQALLNEAKTLSKSVAAEPTLFSIGSRGYYENPTTDILAFFCNDSGAHGLGSLALEALINCLPKKWHLLDCTLVNPPEREVNTSAGKRIDLLLESNDWVIVLENKIFHLQNNPFEEYEKFVDEPQNQNRFANKQVIFVVLSPTGEALPENWMGISYPELITSLKLHLADQFISQPFNKWTLFLREFILHLESLMPQPSMDQKSIEFVLNNLPAINDIQQLKQAAIDSYHQSLQQVIQEQLGCQVNIRLHSWSGFPALRFGLAEWKNTESDVVLYLDGDTQTSTINFYAYLTERGNSEQADRYISVDSSIKCWIEGSGKYRGYSAKLNDNSTEEICTYIAERLSELDCFEKAVRPNESIL